MKDLTKRRLEIAAIAIAFFGAVTSFVFSAFTRIDVNDEHQLKAVELLRARNERIEKWATQVVDAMTEGVFFCELPEPERKAKQLALLVKLSALIDEGRFILPNEGPDTVG